MACNGVSTKFTNISFNRYVAIAGRVLRRALKDDKRVANERLDNVEARVARWKDGKRM